jgi:predicted AlkP superfamily pyrophosphatase or phosphodiesterase
MFSRAVSSFKIAISLYVLAAAPAFAQSRQPVLMISVDGMRPDYVTDADSHHLKIPALRRILAEGAHASGVNGVLPTVTYPSHTTLVTGAWPAEHGILNNGRFDPERRFSGAWYWYSDAIKVPTLWSAARAAGLHTASVSWPVTVDSTDIDFDIPEYWRSAGPGDANNPDDRFLMDAVSRPDGELARIAARIHTPYMMGNDTTLAGDEIRTRFSLDILAQHKPVFMTIHLSSLDEEEHLHGPFSPEANADLEGLDAMVGRLVARELANDPGAAIVIVSDHGFANVDHATNLYVPFLEAGLIEAGKSPAGAPEVKSWKAEPWLAGGMAAILLHDPTDTATRDQVAALLTKLAADPDSGIEAILDPSAIAALGGFPDAAFVVTLKPGYATGAALSGPLVTPMPGRGTHGYNPATTPQMHASFFITGAGIAKAKDLGIIDMRQIAPTLAQLLGVALPTAAHPPLAIH